jgi:hypothetical protein
MTINPLGSPHASSLPPREIYMAFIERVKQHLSFSPEAQAEQLPALRANIQDLQAQEAQASKIKALQTILTHLEQQAGASSTSDEIEKQFEKLQNQIQEIDKDPHLSPEEKASKVYDIMWQQSELEMKMSSSLPSLSPQFATLLGRR